MTTQFQDGGHDVISSVKVPPPDDCTRSVFPALIEQCPAFPDLEYINYFSNLK